MAEEEIESTRRSGNTGEFNIDELGLNDTDMEKVRTQRNAKATADDGWNEEWKGGAWGTDDKQTWATDESWAGDDQRVKQRQPTSGTAAIDLSEFKAQLDNALSMDNAASHAKDGGDSWGGASWGNEENWSDGGPQVMNNEFGDDFNNAQDFGFKASSRDDKRFVKVQASSRYEEKDDSNYRAGQFNKLSLRDGRGGEMGLKNNDYSDRDNVRTNDFQDDGNLDWSGDGPLKDPNAGPRVPAGGAPGADATAAIDLSEFLNSGGSGNNQHQSNASQNTSRGPQAPVGERGVQEAANLVIFADNNEAVEFKLIQGVTSVGRGLDNDIVLADPYASRKHLLIIRRGKYFETADADSDNGSTLNGSPFRRVRLQHRDHIEIGSTILRFISGAPTPDDLIPSSPPQREPDHIVPPPDAPEEKRPIGLIIAALILILALFGAGIALILMALSL